MEKLQEILLALFEQFKVLFPKLVMALGLLVGGWLVARILQTVLRRVLQTLRIDRLSAKLQEIDVVERSGLKIELSNLLSKALYYVLLLIFFVAAADAVGMQVVSEQIEQVIELIPRMVTALMIFIGGLLLANLLRGVVATALKSLGVKSGKILAEVLFYFLLLTFAITALEQGGLNTDFLTKNIQILLGGLVLAFSVGFGLASQGVLKQILAGNYNRRQLRIGDWLRVDGVTGKLLEMDGIKITLLQANGNRMLLPQETLMQSKIEILSEEEVEALGK